MSRDPEMLALLHGLERRVADLEAINEAHREQNGQLRVNNRDLRGALQVMLGIAKRCLSEESMGREALEAEVAAAESVLAATNR